MLKKPRNQKNETVDDATSAEVIPAVSEENLGVVGSSLIRLAREKGFDASISDVEAILKLQPELSGDAVSEFFVKTIGPMKDGLAAQAKAGQAMYIETLLKQALKSSKPKSRATIDEVMSKLEKYTIQYVNNVVVQAASTIGGTDALETRVRLLKAGVVDILLDSIRRVVHDALATHV